MIDTEIINENLYIIIRFITECQIKHSFIFNESICTEVDKCLRYLACKDLKIKTKIPYDKKKIKNILNNVVKNSISIELIFCNDENSIDKSILDKLDYILNEL